MYRIVRKEALKPTVILYEIEAPMVAKKAEPGQFIILRVDENGERIPITIHDYDREKGTVTIIVQTVGATTEKLSHKQQGDFIAGLRRPARPVRPRPRARRRSAWSAAASAAPSPIPCSRSSTTAARRSTPIVGFRNKDIVILEDKFKAASDRAEAHDRRRLLRREGPCHRCAQAADRGGQPVRRDLRHRPARHDEVRLARRPSPTASRPPFP